MRSVRITESLEARRLLAAVYVDVNSPGPVRDGTSWATAYADLQLALQAAPAGTEIRVADGVYKPTNTADRGATFQLKNGVSVVGGYAGFGAPNPDARDVAANVTTLSGDIGAAGAATDNSYHVVTGSGVDASAVLDGVTITVGNADNVSLGAARGGGMFNDAGSPTVRLCTFTDNRAADGGGGVFNHFSAATFHDCTFTQNRATFYGGAMRNLLSDVTVRDCTFEQNAVGEAEGSGSGGAVYDYQTLNGGSTFRRCAFYGNTSEGGAGAVALGLSKARLVDCTFTANVAETGGAVHAQSSSSTNFFSFIRCTFRNNQALGTDSFGSGGGAMRLHNADFAEVRNCLFLGNRSAFDGGAVLATNQVFPTFANCAFANNVAARNGGAFANDGGSLTRLVNCTLAGNAAGPGGGGGMHNDEDSDVVVTNCVIWGNVGGSIVNGPPPSGASQPVVTYSVIEGGHAGTGNSAANPALVRMPAAGSDGQRGTADDDFGDLRLTAGSPAIDAGDDAGIPANAVTDLDGNARKHDVAGVGGGGPGVVDVGAYEFGSAEPQTAVTNVFLAGTAWTTSFRNGLATRGEGEAAFGHRFGPTPQTQTIAYSNLDRISLRFDRAVDVQAAEFLVGGVNVADYGITSFTYDAATFTATWNLNRTIPNDKVTLTLDLDGAPGAEYTSSVRVLPGDVDGNGAVNVFDFNVLKPNLGKTGLGVTAGNINGDSTVNIFDFNDLKTYLGKTTPA